MENEEPISLTLADRVADCMVACATRASAEADRMDEQEVAALVRSALLQQGPVGLTLLRGAWCANSNLRLQAYQEGLPHLRALGAHTP